MCTHVSIIKREKRKEKGRGGSKPPTNAQYTVNTKHNGTEVFLNLDHISITGVPHLHGFHYRGSHYRDFLLMYVQVGDFCINKAPLKSY